MSDLRNLKCKSCKDESSKLSTNDISNNISKLNNWLINDEKEMIYKKFSFKTFKKALDFTNSVGDLAEEEGHHPDISMGWGYCLIMLHTHSIKGLSINDFILASKIDELKL